MTATTGDPRSLVAVGEFEQIGDSELVCAGVVPIARALACPLGSVFQATGADVVPVYSDAPQS